jgi:hypothetical protein
MTQEQITERNKEIALALGWEYVEERDIWNPNMLHDYSFVKSEYLKFHSDWNWIMEAIQFLQDHFESKERSWTTIERYPLYTDIETVFVIVSDFAKHYNEGKL